MLRTERRHNPATGGTYAWLVSSTAMVNHFYFYAVDDDFGPFFLKFCSYFPYNAKLCINGHEYLKRQLTKRGIAFDGNGNQKRDLCGHLKRDPPGEVRRGESEPAAPRESSSTTGFRQYVNPCPPW